MIMFNRMFDQQIGSLDDSRAQRKVTPTIQYILVTHCFSFILSIIR